MNNISTSAVLEELQALLSDLQESLDLPSLRGETGRLHEIMALPDFWGRDDAQRISTDLARLESRISSWDRMSSEYQDLVVLAELLDEEDDQELEAEFFSRSESLSKSMDAFSMELLLNGDYDGNNAIMTVHAGSGGLDSQDWAEMLYRMYLRWCESNHYKTKILDYQRDEEGGIKTVTLLVEGDFAYGYLQSEVGVHRLVRISPFDTAKRRHTSFASVDVAPELPDDVEVDIRTEDLRIDTFRASGAGGQHVNMTDSAVRITHIPTGIVVSCQNERSQHMNKAVAMQVLRGKLYERSMSERQDTLDSLHDKKEISWGNQIRSYVLHPYTMVKDHRTGEETGNAAAVLDGDLERFILSYLRWRKR
ncbi:peptide chain release factor 2 [Dethiosulfovibrio peptidovorans]|uniref:peptide chain release factor 2 n=1 Tax=Dethiosulfovibrio peptidovorans TaxID=47055 RepID=UPI0018DBAB55|nr:peptide chain release factor 2 [Dethiosulfovibrio peptidovorans]